MEQLAAFGTEIMEHNDPSRKKGEKEKPMSKSPEQLDTIEASWMEVVDKNKKVAKRGALSTEQAKWKPEKDKWKISGNPNKDATGQKPRKRYPKADVGEAKACKETKKKGTRGGG